MQCVLGPGLVLTLRSGALEADRAPILQAETLIAIFGTSRSSSDGGLVPWNCGQVLAQHQSKADLAGGLFSAV
jgi:hypothetical protein